MASYLVVANQTALGPELRQALFERTALDAAAEFVLVVPATPVETLVSMEEGHARQIAARRAGHALTGLTEAGLPIVGAFVGAPSLFEAIEEAFSTGKYSGIILCTFPEGASRWLRPGLVESLERAFKVQVTHVTSIHGNVQPSQDRPPGYLTTT